MRRIIFGLVGLFGLAFAAAPASAVNVPGCGEFLIFAKTDIVFEAGLTSLTGNIINVNPTGKIKIGSKNIIDGTVSANKIIVSSGASVTTCVANEVELQGTGANKGVCGTVVSPFAPPAECTATFPPAPLFPQTAFPGVCLPNTAVVVAQNDVDDTLAPGCYKSIRINKGGKLTLTPNGEYFVTGETRLLDGATLIGGGGLPDAAATVNLKGILITEANITLNNLLVQSQNTGGQAINIFNNSLIQDTVLVTLGNLHPHTGGQLRGTTELVADRFLDIQPITNVPGPQVCVYMPRRQRLRDRTHATV